MDKIKELVSILDSANQNKINVIFNDGSIYFNNDVCAIDIRPNIDNKFNVCIYKVYCRTDANFVISNATELEEEFVNFFHNSNTTLKHVVCKVFELTK